MNTTFSRPARRSPASYHSLRVPQQHRAQQHRRACAGAPDSSLRSAHRKPTNPFHRPGGTPHARTTPVRSAPQRHANSRALMSMSRYLPSIHSLPGCAIRARLEEFFYTSLERMSGSGWRTPAIAAHLILSGSRFGRADYRELLQATTLCAVVLTLLLPILAPPLLCSSEREELGTPSTMLCFDPMTSTPWLGHVSFRREYPSLAL